MTAARTQRNDRIEKLIDCANAAFADGDWFDAELHACEAMELSYKSVDFLRMGIAVEALRQCRLSRRDEAVASGAMYSFDTPIGEMDYDVAVGCWLVEPPRVAADARDLREMASQAKVALIALSREPSTLTGLWPVAALGPMVVRAKIRPPSEITLEWFISAIEALGDSAIDDVDPDSGAIDRVEELYLRLQTIPDSMGLHDALLGACREAAAADARTASGDKADQAAA